MHRPNQPSAGLPLHAVPPPRRIRPLATLALLCGLVAPGLTVSASPAYAVPYYCGTEVTEVITWTGSENQLWNNPGNWNTNCVPGNRYLEGTTTVPDSYNQVVKIPARISGAVPQVFLNAGESAHLAALYNYGSLTVAGATLETRSASISHTLTMTRSTLVGAGRFDVTKMLRWNKSTMTSRGCHFAENNCAAPPTTAQKGTTRVKKGATLLLTGYMNLQDQRTIENHGTVTLSSNGYIAADNGTTFINRRDSLSSGRFLIKNDRGYYQGKLKSAWQVGQSKFLNSGTVIKAAGSGASIIEADYADTDPASLFRGVVKVNSGTLSILTPAGTTTREATVQGGSTFGNGGTDSEVCDADPSPTLPPCTKVMPTASDQQVTTVEVPNTTKVTIKELAPVTGYLGSPVEIETPAASATAANPLYFRILLDATELGGKTPAQVAGTAPVQRKASTAGSVFKNLLNCGVQPLTSAEPACVARAMSKTGTTTLGNGDALLVVKSIENSRYRVGG